MSLMRVGENPKEAVGGFEGLADDGASGARYVFDGRGLLTRVEKGARDHGL